MVFSLNLGKVFIMFTVQLHVQKPKFVNNFEHRCKLTIFDKI